MASPISSRVLTRLPLAAVLALGISGAPAFGQAAAPTQAAPASPVPAAAPATAAAPFSGTDENLSADQLQTLVAPVALYPDDLVAIVLPASTQPLQIVDAQRLLDQRKTDPKATPPKSWDPSIVALLNYPEVIALMNKDLTWTQQLGTSVISQQSGVMDAIQTFRKKVQAAGNLKSDDKQKVVVEKETVIIQPADPQVIYVPTYNPTTVIYAPAPAAPPPYAYSAPYPYYASPAAAFFTGAVFGAAIGYAIGWNNHDIYHGDVNINNNVNVNRNFNNTNVNRTAINNQRSNLANNRENAWHPSSSAVNQAQARRTAAGGGARPAVTPNQISNGLAQRGGARPTANGAQGRNIGGGNGIAGNRTGGNAGTRQNALNNRTAGNRSAADRNAGNAGARQNALNNRAAGNRAAAGGGQRSPGSAASRPGGAFSGANNPGAANRASARGNQSLGNHASFQGRAAPAGGGGGAARAGGRRR